MFIPDLGSVRLKDTGKLTVKLGNHPLSDTLRRVLLETLELIHVLVIIRFIMCQSVVVLWMQICQHAAITVQNNKAIRIVQYSSKELRITFYLCIDFHGRVAADLTDLCNGASLR